MGQELPDEFLLAAQAALPILGAQGLRSIGADLTCGIPADATLDSVPLPEPAAVTETILTLVNDSGLSWEAAGSYLIGLADGYDAAHGEQRVNLVWSGPTTTRVPVRSTEQALLDVIDEACHDLLLMTYSAKPHESLLLALAAAVERGVQVDIVVETLAGAGSALQGADPAAAFAQIKGLALWHWPMAKRTDQGAKMHAKLAVADSRLLLTTSANLTASGLGRNIEAGLLVHGGSEPRRAAEHVRELQATGELARYH
jgi:phosphatidylserine/phosphatidylglycerophosphate/cardiolipin synthase-like enzyme